MLNIFAAASLVLAQAASSINPSAIWLAEFLALSYPFLLLLNLIFLSYWLFRWHRLAFISAAVILIGYNKVISLYQPGVFKVDVPEPAGAVKVMSFNVRLFDLYNWSGNEKTRGEIFRFLSKEEPDILCLQEYYHSDGNLFNNNDTLRQLLKSHNDHIVYGLSLRNKDHWGIATFSKFPIVGKGELLMEAGRTNFAIYTDLIFDKDTVRVYNVHLRSNHFKKEDYIFLSNPDSGSSEEIVRKSKGLISRIKESAEKRAAQADELAMHMAASPYRVILCGDFNDPPFTYTYQTLKKDLQDAFVVRGKGIGSTYRGLASPYRIDYILTDEQFLIHRYQKYKVRLSDHFPVAAWMNIRR